MNNRWNYRSYRNMRTTAERRANCEYREDGERIRWWRQSRGFKTLINNYDDKPHCYQKSWKKKRQTKYLETGLHEHKHTLFVEDLNWSDHYTLTQYFDQHSIPYKVEEKGYSEQKVWYQKTKNIWKGVESRIIGNKTYYFPKYKEIKLDKPIRRTYYVHYTEGYLITWWSFKDIGINYILKGKDYEEKVDCCGKIISRSA